MTESASEMAVDRPERARPRAWLLLLGTDSQQVNLLLFRSVNRQYDVARVRIASTARTGPACERLLDLLRVKGVDAEPLRLDGKPVELDANDLCGNTEQLKAAMKSGWVDGETLLLGYSGGTKAMSVASMIAALSVAEQRERWFVAAAVEPDTGSISYTQVPLGLDVWTDARQWVDGGPPPAIELDELFALADSRPQRVQEVRAHGSSEAAWSIWCDRPAVWARLHYGLPWLASPPTDSDLREFFSAVFQEAGAEALRRQLEKANIGLPQALPWRAIRKELISLLFGPCLAGDVDRLDPCLRRLAAEVGHARRADLEKALRAWLRGRRPGKELGPRWVENLVNGHPADGLAPALELPPWVEPAEVLTARHRGLELHRADRGALRRRLGAEFHTLLWGEPGPTSPLAGTVFELAVGVCLADITRRLSGRGVRLFSVGDFEGQELDFLLLGPSGRLIVVEVKSSPGYPSLPDIALGGRRSGSDDERGRFSSQQHNGQVRLVAKLLGRPRTPIFYALPGHAREPERQKISGFPDARLLPADEGREAIEATIADALGVSL